MEQTPAPDSGQLKNGQCSENRPLKCRDQILVNDCIVCGCNYTEGETCNPQTLKCEKPQAGTAIIQTGPEPIEFLPFIALIVFVIIAIAGVNALAAHFREKNIYSEKQRFELAKRKRLLKDLKVAYYKRQLTEAEFKRESLKIQAEIKEIESQKKK